jgi:MFS family permease
VTAPDPPASTPRPWYSSPGTVLRRTFASLQERNYRLYFCGQLVSLTGTWVQQISQNWLVLELTNRSFPVGVNTTLQFLPVLLFGVWGGLIADRFDNRKVLLVTQSVFGVQAVTLCVLTFTGVVQVWMVFALASLYGLVMAVDMPTRQAFVIEMVGPDRLPNAVALNSAIFNVGQVVGPAVAGVSIATLGLGPTFVINALMFPGMMVGLLLMDPSRLNRQPRAARARGQVRAALRYIWSARMLRSVLAVVLPIGVLGLNLRVALPLLARFSFESGASTYGAMTSVMAAGAVLGALVAAGRARPSRGMLVGAALGLGVFILAVGAAPTLPLAMVALVVVGFCTIAFLSTANASLQLSAAGEMRGRVMAVYGTMLVGAIPVGGFVTGVMAEAFGPRAPLWLGGAGCLAAAAIGFVLLRRPSPGEGAVAEE